MKPQSRGYVARPGRGWSLSRPQKSKGQCARIKAILAKGEVLPFYRPGETGRIFLSLLGRIFFVFLWNRQMPESCTGRKAGTPPGERSFPGRGQLAPPARRRRSER